MTVTSTAPRAAPGWRKPALAIGAAFAITLAALGTTLLLTRGGEEAPPITTITTLPPTTTLPATTTTQGAVSVEGWSYPVEEVPPFHATIAWDRNPESTWRIGYQGSTATVEVWYEAPLRFRFQLVELDTDLVAQGVPGAGQHMGGPGSYIVADGETMAHWWASDEMSGGAGPAWHYLAFMFWEPETSEDPFNPFDWAGECREHTTSLTEESVAGRDAYHIACSTVRGDWDLWVDTETGLILKLRGETEADDRLLGTSPEGGFEVTGIEFPEDPFPEALFEPPGGALPSPEEAPPLHAVYVAGGVTTELWQANRDTWRRATAASDSPANPEMPTAGEYTIVTGEDMVFFYPETEDGYVNAYLIGEVRQFYPPGYPYGGADALLLEASYSSAPDDPLLPAECTEVTTGLIAGRPATRLRCEYATEHGAQWTDDVWVDQDSGLVLQKGPLGSPPDMTVLSLEIDPVFPEGIFTFTPEPGWCNLTDGSNCIRSDIWAGTYLSQDEEVPTFTGPLADGTPFDLADLRGRPVIVFFWMDAFRAGLLEQWLAEFEALYQEWGDRVAFVSVPEMDVVDARRFVERVPLTHLVIACYDNSVAAQQTNVVCSPDSPPSLWRMGWPSWVTIDAEGRALDRLTGGNFYTYEALNDMIAAAVGG